MVEELRAVVAVKAKDRECDSLLNIPDLEQDSLRALSPDSTVLGPTGKNVGKSKAEDEITSHGIAAMCNRISLKITGPRHIPVVRLDRNLIFEKRSWFGRTTPFLVE